MPWSIGTTGRVVKGDEGEPSQTTEVWTFVRKAEFGLEVGRNSGRGITLVPRAGSRCRLSLPLRERKGFFFGFSLLC